MYILLFLIAFLLFTACVLLVLHNHNSSSVRVRKIVSKDLNGKTLFILRVNSSDFLFEDNDGEVSILTKIKEPAKKVFNINTELAEKAIHLLELENMGRS